jgi:hypothetical protein
MTGGGRQSECLEARSCAEVAGEENPVQSSSVVATLKQSRAERGREPKRCSGFVVALAFVNPGRSFSGFVARGFWGVGGLAVGWAG